MASRVAMVCVAAATAFLLFVPSAAAGASSAHCDPSGHASLISLMCVGSGSRSVPTACCRAVRHAARHGGLKCLCLAAAEPRTLASGFTVEVLLRWYTRCGGSRSVNLHDLASTCSDAAHRAGGDHTAQPKHHHHHHHKHNEEQKASSFDQVPIIIQQPESFKDKAEKIIIVVVLCALGLGALGCSIYVISAGRGRRVDRAKRLWKSIEPLIPPLMDEWMARRDQWLARRETTSTTVVAHGDPTATSMSSSAVMTRRKTPSP